MSRNALVVVDDDAEFAQLLPALRGLTVDGCDRFTLAAVVPFSAVMVDGACAGITAYDQVRFMVDLFEVSAAGARSHLRRLNFQAQMAGYAADIAVACGAPFEEIARLAQSTDADVIALVSAPSNRHGVLGSRHLEMSLHTRTGCLVMRLPAEPVRQAA